MVDSTSHEDGSQLVLRADMEDGGAVLHHRLLWNRA